MEFGFFRGLPDHLQLLDILGQVVFMVDVILQFFVAYTDTNVEDMVYSRNLIALRSVFIFQNEFSLQIPS